MQAQQAQQPQGRPTLSVAIITHNEEANLLRLLPVLAGIATEMVIVDSGSSDGTLAVAAAYRAHVFHQEWLGFGPQKNVAIAACSGDWILSLDADEEPSAELLQSIARLLAAPPGEAVAYRIARRNLFLGRWMRHGGLYPDPKLRLFRRGQARYEERAVHESMDTAGSVGELTGDLIHHAYPSLALYLEHMNRYSSAGAAQAVARGRVGRSAAGFFLHVIVNPVATFAYNYVLRGGFLDGREGLLQHLYHSCYVSWKYAKAWEQARISR